MERVATNGGFMVEILLELAAGLPINLRQSASFWSAPALWRFDHGRELIDGRNLAPRVIIMGGQSARGLAHSKTLPRRFTFMAPMREPKTAHAANEDLCSAMLNLADSA